jgi:hypothetical protein
MWLPRWLRHGIDPVNFLATVEGTAVMWSYTFQPAIIILQGMWESSFLGGVIANNKTWSYSVRRISMRIRREVKKCVYNSCKRTHLEDTHLEDTHLIYDVPMQAGLQRLALTGIPSK